MSSYAYVNGNPISDTEPMGLVKIPGIPRADGETSIHANPGPDATDFRPEHGPAHVHLGKNDGPRVRTSDFKPFSEEDAKGLTRKQKQFCEQPSDESKNSSVNGKLKYSKTAVSYFKYKAVGCYQYLQHVVLILLGV